jgi:D-serine deaminase-like pyridoxal phosphate-dependent protein
MDPQYRINDTSQIFSPALVVFRDLVVHNLRLMNEIAGDPARLRPHCKTHKMAAVTRLEMEMGITKHKCATLAEAEMLADAGVKDIFLAYNLIGPNVQRATRFLQKYPDVRFIATADHAEPLRQLGRALTTCGQTMGIALDIDTGHHRTGLLPNDHAVRMYGLIADTEGVEPAGIHLYDGQNHQTPIDERRAAVEAVWDGAMELRDRLLANGWPVPRIVAGGTGSFPIFAALRDETLELSPGTVVFHDSGYARIFPDLHFVPAALLLTRVVSRPSSDRITLDVGNKAVAADPPVGQRLAFPDLPEAREVLHNEEHLVLETPLADRFQPGDELLAIPRHICPTSALHKHVWVIQNGNVVDRWEVTARDRCLTI